jgi:hypothetical protein
MFLFTTPASSAAAASADTAVPRPAGEVVDAIRTGSEKTGADFDYLLKTASRESSLDPAARARTSSASGLFQFIEQTWLGVVKGAGANHGLGEYAQAITEVKPGRYDVSDPQTKAHILSLRNDPQTAAVMAGEFTRRNEQTLGSLIGRLPTDGELYAAHFMGAAGAADLIKAAQSRPTAAAADLFPDHAAANRAIFYDKASGTPRTVSDVYSNLTAQGRALAKLPGDPATWRIPQAQQEPIAAPAYVEHPGGPAIYGLFRTEGARGPLNQAVEKLWSGQPARAVSAAPGFFPRTASLQSPVSDAPAPGAIPAAAAKGAAQPADVPLPPVRPASLPAVRPAPAAPAAASALPGTRKGPLDLLAFLKPTVTR